MDLREHLQETPGLHFQYCFFPINDSVNHQQLINIIRPCWAMHKAQTTNQSEFRHLRDFSKKVGVLRYVYGYGSIPRDTIFRGMNIHLPAILMFTRGTIGFDTLPYFLV